ncbi:MAG TPA: alpha/beta family hydrolase [Mycobacteriales bacterium]|nr:alpha/beta family hydrolase [Mycobacteriales bacterium]
MSPAREQIRSLATPVGEARAVLTGRGGGLAVLGHGAGGGVGAADLVAVTGALVQAGWTVARVEQPYRVQGRRAPDRAPRLDAAWTAVVEQLTKRRSGPLLVGGRSSGARVACRTADAVGADAVLGLAFPLHPPGRVASSRSEELALVGDRPLLVVQGDRDPFGTAAEFPPDVEVVSVPGDHSLRRTTPVVEALLGWLAAQALT